MTGPRPAGWLRAVGVAWRVGGMLGPRVGRLVSAGLTWVGEDNERPRAGWGSRPLDALRAARSHVATAHGVSG
jgi:hypothetical protein